MIRRDFNLEYQESQDRKYAYDFDYLMHGYFMRVFAPFLSGKKALELGCYEGEFTAKILDHFEDVTVIEASSALVEKAKARVGGSARFVHSTFEHADMGGATFDAIFLIHTMEHLDRPSDVLQHVKNWLSPTGKLIVAVPNANAISRQIAVKMGRVPFNAGVTDGEFEHGHRRTYSLDTLEYEMNKCGFGIIESGGVFFKPLANFQLDAAIEHGIVDGAFLEACFALGNKYPDFCASVYVICQISEKYSEDSIASMKSN